MMKANIIKRVLSSALVLSLVMAPAVGAYASTTVVSGNCATSEVSTGSTGSSTTVATVKELPTTSAVAGVKTTVSGVYVVNKVNGCAITTDLAAISQGYGLASGEKLFAKIMDMDAKKSNLAKACMDAAAAAMGAEVGPCLNIELGKMAGGKYSVLPTEGAAIRIAVGIPGNFAEAGKTYAMVRVRVGGVVDILADVDTNPNTITFDTTAGAGAYAIIKY